MREQLRNELLAALGESMGAEDLRAAERAIDAVISRYDVRPAEMHLAVQVVAALCASATAPMTYYL